MPKARNPQAQLPTGPRATRRLFTNRVSESRLVLDLLGAPAGAPLPLVMFYGVGGAGKTRLLDHVTQRCQARGLPWASVDLAELREADQALPELAAQFEHRHGVSFPSFKQALAVLAARRGGGALTARVSEYVKSTGETVTDTVLDGLGLIPAVGQLAAVVKLAKGASQVAFKQAMQRKSFRDAMLRLGGEGELLELVEWSHEQLLGELQRRFAADLVRGLPPALGQAGRAALFLDTHEALWQDTKGGAGTQDAWIRLLREYLHDQGVLMVVAGRDRLRWPDDWTETDAEGRALWLTQYRVGGLSVADAREYLHRADVDDVTTQPFTMPRELQAAILRVTNEEPDPAKPSQHHCYLLALCAEVVANSRATTGDYPAPDEIQAIPTGDAAAEPLARRFLLSLRNEQMVNWLEELALSPRFDEEYALALDVARRHMNARAGWERLRELSLVELWEDGFLELYALLRESLRRRVEPGRAAAVHAWAAGAWAQQARTHPPGSEGDWLRQGYAWYHQRFVDHAAALDGFIARRKEAETRADAEAVRALARWWDVVVLTRTPVTAEQARDLTVYADTLRALTTGDHEANLARAIASYEAALQLYTEEEFPESWAATQNSLGNAYLNRPTGDRTANVRQAIACYEAALRVRDETTFPEEWAATQNNLGNAYSELPTGDRAANLERAIACYEAALRVYTEDAFPVDWAGTRTNLGVAYLGLPTGDRGANLQRAIAHQEAALRVFTEAAFPSEWARTQTNLGVAYSDLPAGDREANLRRAIACYEEALAVRTETSFPVDWARTQNNLGNAYLSLPTGDRAANLARAIACYEAALRVRTEAAFPVDWARTQNNLGSAYGELPTGDRTTNLQQAIGCFEAALRVYSEASFPYEWASMQFNLGSAQQRLHTGDRRVNLCTAIECFEQALRVWTETAYPGEWAETQRALARVYLDLTPFDGATALSHARDRCHAALRVFDREGTPVEWAQVMVCLATASRVASSVDAAELPRALSHLDAALAVLTEDDAPAEWAEAQAELGRALKLAGDHERARVAFTDAARGYRSVGMEAQAREADDARAALLMPRA